MKRDSSIQSLITLIHQTDIDYLFCGPESKITLPAAQWEALEQDSQDDIRFAAHEARVNIQFLAFNL